MCRPGAGQRLDAPDDKGDDADPDRQILLALYLAPGVPPPQDVPCALDCWSRLSLWRRRAAQQIADVLVLDDVAAVAGLSLVALWAALSGAPAKSGTQTGNEPSSPLLLAGKTLDGERYDLTNYRGRLVVINFFASWCPSCAKEAADLTAFAKEHPEVAFVGVDIRDTPAKSREWVMKYGVPFPIILDVSFATGRSHPHSPLRRSRSD